jgi:hypothetical protein
MTIPTLTTGQIFTNQVTSVITLVANALQGNISMPPAIQGQPLMRLNFAAVYNGCESVLFSNENGTGAEAMTILSTQAGNVMAFLTGLYTFLTTAGVTSLIALPAYTVNNDGTVTLS